LRSETPHLLFVLFFEGKEEFKESEKMKIWTKTGSIMNILTCRA
jgi:hypothetical protein